MKTALALSGGKDSLACFFLMKDELDCAIYVDTGFSYPETRALVAMVAQSLPVYTVYSARAAQNDEYGIPSDVVPVNWTHFGQAVTTKKPAMIQPYLQCCFSNMAEPLFAKAKELQITHLVTGQRQEDTHRSTARHGETVEGLVRMNPLEAWSKEQVLSYLASHMTLPAHFRLTHSSLDCYDCPAYAAETQDRVAWTELHHPEFAAAHRVREQAVADSIHAALSGGGR